MQARADLHDAIRELKATGVITLLATHDMAEAESLCDRIAIIIHGHIAAIGTPAQITSAGHSETRITLRTKINCLLPGRRYRRFPFHKANGRLRYMVMS